ncbi:MAG: hypothetical protein V7K64_19305 [Nostoc sp.]|uniref:hypothetical protein n=1 Tax=unclassified Nostoc TaxID=2593658 RepID=UPI001D45FFEE|nr:hypothetical protein [Nostoc sp. JL34]MBN3885759.1 hypothetical protein [Nostoc sp. JL34]
MEIGDWVLGIDKEAEGKFFSLAPRSLASSPFPNAHSRVLTSTEQESQRAEQERQRATRLIAQLRRRIRVASRRKAACR